MEPVGPGPSDWAGSAAEDELWHRNGGRLLLRSGGHWRRVEHFWYCFSNALDWRAPGPSYSLVDLMNRSNRTCQAYRLIPHSPPRPPPLLYGTEAGSFTVLFPHDAGFPILYQDTFGICTRSIWLPAIGVRIR